MQAAVEGLTDVLRLEMVEHGVSVSALEPAYVATPIFGKITQVGGRGPSGTQIAGSHCDTRGYGLLDAYVWWALWWCAGAP